MLKQIIWNCNPDNCIVVCVTRNHVRMATVCR